MALSVVDLYRDVLPRTNCGDCGFPTCLAFAGMVVSESHPLKNCPHLAPEVVERCDKELKEQYAAKKWTKRDMAEDALKWARERSASMKLEDLPDRIGGRLLQTEAGAVLELPYFTTAALIGEEGIFKKNGEAFTRWEQVFIYNHMAQGGASEPTGNWKGFIEFPNTVSKAKNMKADVENPLIERFRGKPHELSAAALELGGRDMRDEIESADVAVMVRPLPKVPVMVMFWDEEKEDGFEAAAKLMFDETITDHLDIESIMFLSERLRQLLCE
ncbi:MAG: DUF3786 domain-containing protein [Desulfobacterales bacterium]|nr:DUF3786 domain-containing protein [Desulfobacterales bacterium]